MKSFSGNRQQAMAIDSLIRVVHDFPTPGVVFRDVSPVLTSNWLSTIVHTMAGPFVNAKRPLFAGLDSRGFIFAAGMAVEHDCGFLMVRKAGKLPPPTDRAEYALEYGAAAFEIPTGIIYPGQHVVIVDDVLATGGSARGAARLVKRQGGIVVGFSFMVEIEALGGADAIRKAFGADARIHSLLTY